MEPQRPKWEDALPDEMKQMLEVTDTDLDDTTDGLRRMEALTRVSYRRALEGVAQQQYTQGEIVEMGDDRDVPVISPLSDKDVSKRVEVYLAAEKSLLEQKKMRIELKEKHADKVKDKPKPANLTFQITAPSARNQIQKLIRLGRTKDAHDLAKYHGLDYAELEAEITVEA
jgi:hypothetical protein